ncbi:unnamed protein product [Schistocephalus solidus]|uniref:Uncharacterized protein n=1 Tax=Schistocephalus solidus TaxID=70667 RepID=A0A183TTD4_SCHSO|nr:unnamed protein product [Schistocephalus solidus]
MALVTLELAQCKMDLAALSETRFSEHGQLEEVGAGYTFFWSGRPKAERRDAPVAVVIHMKTLWDDWPVCCRFTSIISAYDPNPMSSFDEAKNKADEGLRTLLSSVLKVAKLIVLDGYSLYVTLGQRPTNPDSELGVDQIFTLRRILEFHHGYQQPTAVCFIEFTFSFNFVHRESLGRMEIACVLANTIAFIKAYYRSTTA